MEQTVRAQRFGGPRRERGLTMVELMVGILIALIGTIVIFQVFAVSEEYKRRTTGGSDAIQSANFSLYQLERQFSWVGAGLARMPNLWGCLVTATPALPAPPAPFDVLGTQVRMAPLLIRDGGGANPDVLLGIGGSNDSVNTPVVVTAPPPATPAQVSLTTTLGVKQKDFLLIVEQEITGNPCRLAQVTSATPAPIAPAKVGVIPNPVALSAAFNGYTGSAKVANLGAGLQITAFTVGDDPATGVKNVLLTYDVFNGGQPVSLADNVVNVQAVYGVAASPTDPKVAQWVPPTAPWDWANLNNGSAASADLIARLRAVRIAVVARNAQWEKDQVSPASFALFADLPAATVTVNLTAAERQYRYKVFDEVIPLRNMIIANN
jgi:type IV pilus assembly protein PilW